ncbi:MAG: helix-turn-helix transcriptional regulator [Bacilli bacterium]
MKQLEYRTKRIQSVDKRFAQALGNQLRIIREKRRLSLRDVQKKTGFSKTLLDYWELGLTRIKPEQLELLCKTYDISNNLDVKVRLGFLVDD